mgnify:CR=1 FL=1|tara:strand:+ start:854 stop:1225 length:372 start_codon:yes stop_codon:yes gene_type:complete
MVSIKQKLSKEVLQLLDKDKTKKFTDVIELKIIEDLIIKYDTHILDQTKSRLDTLGFNFNTENDFIDFCIARVQKVNYENKPNYFEMYLDYQNTDKKGTLLLFGNDNIKVDSIKDGKITYTIG